MGVDADNDRAGRHQDGRKRGPWSIAVPLAHYVLHNAVKFTRPGGRTETRVRREQGADAAVISVSDTGIGIGPDVLHRLFEPFMQVDNAVDRSRGGLGLGLSLVKSLVHLTTRPRDRRLVRWRVTGDIARQAAEF